MIKIHIMLTVFLTASILNGSVTVTNRTDLPIKVYIHFIGIGSPSIYELKAGETQQQYKDLANIKTGYDVWIKDGVKYRKIISEHHITDAGAFRKLDVLQDKDPETGEILYSINRSGY